MTEALNIYFNIKASFDNCCRLNMQRNLLYPSSEGNIIHTNHHRRAELPRKALVTNK